MIWVKDLIVVDGEQVLSILKVNCYAIFLKLNRKKNFTHFWNNLIKVQIFYAYLDPRFF